MILSPEQTEVLTLADAVRRLGSVPLDRIRWRPALGTATEQDVVEIHDRTNHLVELVDGILVDKPMGFMESRIAIVIAHILEGFMAEADLGIVAGADGMMRLAAG